MVSERERGWSAWLLVVVVAVACFGEEPLRFGVTFEDRHDLEAGAPVFYKGLEIGEVSDVGLDERGNVLVRVEVEAEYRSAVARNSVITIERSGGIVGLGGVRHLEVRDGEGERIPIEAGEVLSGHEVELGDRLTELREAARAAWERTREVAGELRDEIQELTESSSAGELLESMEELTAEARERILGREGEGPVSRDRLSKMREKGEELRRELLERGLEEEAASFWTRFSRWLEELERPPAEDPDTVRPPGEPAERRAPENG